MEDKSEPPALDAVKQMQQQLAEQMQQMQDMFLKKFKKLKQKNKILFTQSQQAIRQEPSEGPMLALTHDTTPLEVTTT